MGYIVALTGGIGSGKSTVARAFSRLGISCVDADIIASQILKINKPALQKITAYLGDSILNHDGTLNRRELRERIFANPAERSWLNSLLHPLIHQETQRQISKITSPYVLWIIPLLIENQLAHEADRVLVVDISPQIQVKRTMIRDNVSRRHVELILASQATREMRLAVADDVICNDGRISTIDTEVAGLHMRYMRFATQI